jgi:hypothetical protein
MNIFDPLSLRAQHKKMVIAVRKSARRELLSRLLRLNHERWEEEQKEGEGGEEKKVKKSKSNAGQMGLL